MAQARFLIAPIKEGLRTDLRPWLLPEGAFARLENAYMYEGRIRKRFGSTFTGSGWTDADTQSLFSRLRIALSGGAGVGSTDPATGDAAGFVPGAIFKAGQMFSIGTTIYTVYQDGAMLQTDATITATYNTATGAYSFVGAPVGTQIYFYPAEPVMGLKNFESNLLNNRPAIAFDTQFAYKFVGGFWDRVGPTAGSQFHGSNSQFFQASNWRGATSDVNLLFVSNFNASMPAVATDDAMWRFDGTAMTGWTEFQPVFIVGANFVRTAKIILPFKDRLILLNTIENNGGAGLGVNTSHQNRCRFSHNGSPLAASAFYEPNQVGATGGGWIDAATKEEIIGAEFIKDRLIIYFERSTWELAYTGNAVQPFVWQKINTELGSQSTFSTVPFDKAILGIGTTGIHACNGANVERIDNEIPDEIFQIRHGGNGPYRVAGIRDYITELVYWTIPVANADQFAVTYPNKILVYNYKDGTWAFNDDSITAFGFFEQQTGKTWATTTLSWQECNFAWNSGTIQPVFRQIIAGNQQGYVFKLKSDVSVNESVMQISNLTAGAGNAVVISVIDHNLSNNDFIKISTCQGVVTLNDNIYRVVANSADEIRVEAPGFAGVYTGGGTIARVSRIDILTKRYNPYIKDGRNVSIESADFAVQRTANGQVTIDYFTSSSGLSMIGQGDATGASLGTNVLETSAYDLVPLERSQELLWHKVYFNARGDSVQLRIYLDDDQMTNLNVVSSDFQLEGFILNMMSMGRVD